MSKLKKHINHIAGGAVMFTALMSSASISDFGGSKNKCNGTERWMVKTMQDQEAEDISLRSRGTVSITDLIETERPEEWSKDEDSERLPDEFDVYTVPCKIAVALPQADGDIHLELVDPKNKQATLVAEIPNPACPNVKNSPFADEFRKVRNEFINKHQHSFTKGTYLVKGVVFFDKRNHGKGGNQNGVELHPIISIRKMKS
jgi:hypothetical protein